MPYFKHAELANQYHVSLKTVHNWIDAAKQGKLELELHDRNSRTYVANTQGNTLVLKQLADQGKKYRNARFHKVIQPTPEFYDIYTRRQILDIITNLSAHGEIPSQYGYLKDGAAYWDNWVKRLAHEHGPNTLTGSIELIRANMSVIERLLESGKRVNVIDLGVGNAYPIRELLGRLLDLGILHRYIGVDISPSMLAIAERNIKDWFGGGVHFEGHVRDISYERFDDLLVDDMLDKEAEKTINLVLILGGTPVNHRSFANIFRVAYASIGSNDLLMYTTKPDTETSRRYFDFSPEGGAAKLPQGEQYILDLLNIDESLYDTEMGFDEDQRMRFIRVRLKTAITLTFDFGDTKRYVTLEKGNTILLLRMWHLTAREIISVQEQAGLTLLQSSLTKDRRYLLTISGVETKTDALA